jgi:hypothetical protein
MFGTNLRHQWYIVRFLMLVHWGLRFGWFRFDCYDSTIVLLRHRLLRRHPDILRVLLDVFGVQRLHRVGMLSQRTHTLLITRSLTRTTRNLRIVLLDDLLVIELRFALKLDLHLFLR